ncbi:MAG: 50S ribosomal protein L25 [Gammaproteobacteria bacterium]|nr:MAG: 50S ribosomal protein L25 [Gammaproteobacteria bacterium]
METFEIIAEPREDMGKGASRRLRREGKVPGVVYGANKDAASIMVKQNEIFHHLENEAFYSHILTLQVGKAKEKVVLKDLQRHPYKALVLHLDLLRVDENETLTMRVPLHFINEDICIGVKQDGGVVSHVMTDLEIVCLPKDLPEYIEVDVAEVNVGEGIHLSDLKLPEGTEIAALLHGGDAAQIVATVHIPKVIVEIEDELVDEVEGEEGDAEAGDAEATPDEGADAGE